MLEFLEKPGVVIVILLAIVVFGAKRLPDSARALGRSMRILKAEAKGLREDGTPADGTAAPAPKALPESGTPTTGTPTTSTAETAPETPRQT